MTDKLDMIYDLVKEIDKKQDFQSERLAKLEVLVEINTKDLTEHKEGVIGNRKLIAQNEKRHEQICRATHGDIAKKLIEIEAPKNTAKTVVKWIAGIAGFVATVAAAIFGVMRIMKL